MSPERDLVFVGDVHLEPDDPALPAFLRFLERIGREADRVVLMGDLFTVWVGDRALEQPHQSAVIDRLAALRGAGVRVSYLEGNRDYRIGGRYVGLAFDEATDRGIVELAGPRSLFAIHGDLANPADRLYRMWRGVSRSRVAWAALSALPHHVRRRLVDVAERRLRGANLGFKGAFPEAVVRAYAAPLLADGHDAVVLGHFHVERDLAVGAGGRTGRILVLPEWRDSRRHLRARPLGEVEFVDS